MKVIVTLDGEVLVSKPTSQGLQGQKEAIANIVDQLGPLLQDDHQLIIVHGNGPQVGSMLLRGEIASHAVYPVPLDVCGADTQGATGYFLQQALQNWLKQKGLQRNVTTIVTQVLVDKTDPELSAPIKGIGPFFDAEKAQTYGNTRAWEFILVPGRGQQRAVPALLPRQILEVNSIRCLATCGTIVICAGGGGIPVSYDTHGNLAGVEVVVNKSHTATLLAGDVGADTVVFVSQWEKIRNAFPQTAKDRLMRLTLSELKLFIEKYRDRLENSMYLKLLASCKFLQGNGRSIWIISPDQLGSVLNRDLGINLISDPE